jgi:hypothetical protein
MSDARVTRLMGPLGILILVLLGVGFGALNGGQPNENASGVTDVTWMNAHTTMRWAQIYVLGLALALFLVYVTQLRRILKDASGSEHLWPNLVFAAGIVFVAGELVAGAVNATVFILAAHNHQYTIAHFANFVGQNSEAPMIFGLALFSLSLGLAVLTKSTLPKWLGIVALVLGVVAVLGPIGFLGTLAIAIWIPVTGFVVGSKSRTMGTVSV